MEIEPLKSILEWSEDKKDVLMYYLPLDVKKKVVNLEFEEKSLYVHDRIFCIKRNTLELEHQGTIVYIEGGKMGLKVNSVKTVTLDPKKYYIFVKCKKTISKQREFMKQLLEQL
tara:strand:- start:373 stop:714 length:342 start_codon:yes stop_codon:yes gene_type:complete